MRSIAFFASISGHENFTIGKLVDGQETIIGTFSAAYFSNFSLDVERFLRIQQRRSGAVSPLVKFVFRNQGAAVGSHKPCDIRANRFPLRNNFKAAQDRIVVKGSALYDQLFAHLLGGFDFDYLSKRIPNHGVRKACGNICYACPFLLRLLDARIHKYGASGAQIHRFFCFQRLSRKFCNIDRQRRGKRFYKGTAAGGAGFVQHDALDYAVFNFKALHILPADIQYEVDARQEFLGGFIVSNRFDFPDIDS